ncbi:MAG: hypothetical protein JWM80_6494 [Cyanobacteria bacterium RYN_339]|nr:hypothetical protein [Cyanobacteria bacterium RYN_339]
MWQASILTALAATLPWLPAASTPEALIGPAWTVLGKAEGDLDGDGRPDVALALGRKDEEQLQEAPRWLLIARRGRDGKLRPWASSTGPVLCRQCGGVFGDPFEELAIRDGVLMLRHYAGSNWRWSLTDRFLWQAGAWRHIGKTHTDTFTNDLDYMHERDHNLITGYVIVTRKGMGLAGRQAYHEVWAPRLAKLAFPGRPTRLVTAADVVEGRAGWKGANDLSASVAGTVVGDRLWIEARITDDHVTAADAMQVIDAQGHVVAPLESHQAGLPGGWRAWAAYPVAKLVGKTNEDVLQASVEIVDDDGAGRPRKVLSTSQGGRAYPGAIRRAASLRPPDLGGADPRSDAIDDDLRLDALDN